MEDYFGYDKVVEQVSGRTYIIVKPKEGTANGRWALKTEYFEAFPAVQLDLLKLGYHVVHMVSTNRWNPPEDTDARADLARYLHDVYGLSRKCVIIGMSCGGMQGIYFAAKYPQYVSCLYLDAPVVNLLSCPAGLGRSECGMLQEFEKARGMTLTELLSYRNHPLDHIPELVQHNIPVMLVCGDSDRIVPYEENGKLLWEAYVKNGCTIERIVKPGCDHHPHSLEDTTPILDFILKYDRDE